jgi:aminoglycoside 6-adenylyltransferase
MRNEIEVFTQILAYADNNDGIRAVILNGSRVNPNVSKDRFCDYDVVFAVTDPNKFLYNQEWIKYFGDLIMMQQNNMSKGHEERYIFLMLFTDGVRIDLSFLRVETINDHIDDSLTKVLLDKDKVIKSAEPASDRSYWTNKPTQKEFAETINDIWWCSTNVAKGLWRGELPYAKYMMDVIVRNHIVHLLQWQVGMNNDWRINTGLAGKWLSKFLSAELWEAFISTYSGADYEDIWTALFETGRLTRKVGQEIADQLGFEYPLDDDMRVTEYLRRIAESIPK